MHKVTSRWYVLNLIQRIRDRKTSPHDQGIWHHSPHCSDPKTQLKTRSQTLWLLSLILILVLIQYLALGIRRDSIPRPHRSLLCQRNEKKRKKKRNEKRETREAIWLIWMRELDCKTTQDKQLKTSPDNSEQDRYSILSNISKRSFILQHIKHNVWRIQCESNHPQRLRPSQPAPADCCPSTFEQRLTGVTDQHHPSVRLHPGPVLTISFLVRWGKFRRGRWTGGAHWRARNLW